MLIYGLNDRCNKDTVKNIVTLSDSHGISKILIGTKFTVYRVYTVTLIMTTIATS